MCNNQPMVADHYILSSTKFYRNTVLQNSIVSIVFCMFFFYREYVYKYLVLLKINIAINNNIYHRNKKTNADWYMCDRYMCCSII